MDGWWELRGGVITGVDASHAAAHAAAHTAHTAAAEHVVGILEVYAGVVSLALSGVRQALISFTKIYNPLVSNNL